MMKWGEFAALAIIGTVMIGLAAWGQHHKSAAETARADLAACALRAMNLQAQMDALADETRARAEAAQKALDAAQKDAQRHAKRADALLRAPAAVPGDDCASAKARAKAWLEGR